VRDFAAYATSKAGPLVATRVLAKELGARGITANAVLSGAIAAGFLDLTGPVARSMAPGTLERIAASAPAGRLGTPEDIAAVVAFLAGPAAQVHKWWFSKAWATGG